MPVFAFAYAIAAAQNRPSDGDGFVRAETIRQTVALVGHPDVNVFPFFKLRLRTTSMLCF